jgi:hypothetical protein
LLGVPLQVPQAEAVALQVALQVVLPMEAVHYQGPKVLQ